MIRINEICNELIHLVGWDDERKNKLSYDLTKSESGLTFQGAHPLITIENIRNIMPELNAKEHTQFTAGDEYEKGEVVYFDGKLYQSDEYIDAITSSSHTPAELLKWHLYDDLSDYLDKVTRYGITASVQKFLRIKQLNNETRNILERVTFFDGAGRVNNTIKNNHKIVGFELTPVRAMGVTTKIEGLGLQSIGVPDDDDEHYITIYLYHSSQSAPMRTKKIKLNKNKNGVFSWYDEIDFFLTYINSQYDDDLKNDVGGSWYLVYSQDEFPMGVEAVNSGRDWSKEPCSSCNARGSAKWREMTKYLQIAPFMVEKPYNWDSNHQIWDLEKMLYTSSNNFGLNCTITVGCDLTDFIISQKNIFANVVQLEVAAKLLRTMAMNPDVRVNRNQSNVTRLDILYELDGNTNGRAAGIMKELEDSYNAINIDTKGLDRVCLTCNNKGVKYTTV